MKKKTFILLIVCILTALVSLLTISPSVMNYTTDDFNSKNCLIDLQAITEKPHSVFDYENHEEVRLYLKERLSNIVGQENVLERNYLTKSNQNPTTNITYVSDINPSDYNVDEKYDVRNLLAKIPGKNETGILLVSHYDSRGNIKRLGETAHSYGCGDDGYGVSSILEMLSYIKRNNVELENSIYVLFADCEETGMYGSLLETKNTQLMDKINFVINIESRGMDGATYMFETSKNNKKVIELYNKSNSKLSYSIAPAVYSIMTNFTDFTNFLEIGKQGLNFTTLNNIDDYHVATDNYQNVNPASLQHYGEHILPVVLEYVSNSKYSDMNYFNSNSDMVFFNLFPNVFISYNEVVAIVLAIIILIALVVFIILDCKDNEINVKLFFKKFGLIWAFVIASVIVSQVISMYLARLNGYKWNLTNVRFENSEVITMAVLVLFAYLITKYSNKLNKNDSQNNHYLLSAVCINTLFLLLTSFVLSGASYVFIVPAILGVSYLYINKYTSKPIYKTICLYVSIIVFISLFVPLMLSLLYALTIGGLLAFSLLTFIPFVTLVPMIKNYLQ